MGTVPNFSVGQKERSQLSPAPSSRIRGRTPFSPLKTVYQIFRLCQGLICSRRESNPAFARFLRAACPTAFGKDVAGGPDSQFSGLKPYPLGDGSIISYTAKVPERFQGKWGLSLSPRTEGKHD